MKQGATEFRPPAWGQRYAAAIVDPNVRPREEDRCTAAEVNRVTVWRAKRDPRFVAWLEGEVMRISAVELATIRSAISRLAIGGSLEAATVWLDRFEKQVKVSRPGQVNPTTLTTAEKIEKLLTGMGAINDELDQLVGRMVGEAEE